MRRVRVVLPETPSVRWEWPSWVRRTVTLIVAAVAVYAVLWLVLRLGAAGKAEQAIINTPVPSPVASAMAPVPSSWAELPPWTTEIPMDLHSASSRR